MNSKYEKILSFPRPSSQYPKMSRSDRAAQFAPFSALVGYEESLSESRRMTEEKRVLSDVEMDDIKCKLDWVLEHLHLTPIVSLSYFVPDTKKSGGQHITVPFQVKRFDEEKQELVSVEKERVRIEEIVGVEILERANECDEYTY